MDFVLNQDENGTHIDWEISDLDASMIDWFWANMEKCFILWHPEEHEPLVWFRKPQHGNLVGAIHIAPQTWSDGQRQELYIRFEDLKSLPDKILNYVHLDHCIVVAGLGLGEATAQKILENESQIIPLGYRIHQWSNTKSGVKGQSNAFGWLKYEDHVQGKVWAKHAATEIGNWGVFLKPMYELYQVVKNPDYNPFMDLTVVKNQGHISYKLHLDKP